ncbi:hypothetical protein BDZ94DRAFT_779175 [Collybia nuda]|uniref:Glutathione S-transferase UstS-like C-terminal domain-containing protein n=1 Tax=Collybia nuda TaxID=64659 RepID=A0A9P5YGP9_9AGAR|nr:hypothetical protein BDZ94DRAFT_779175 [Collybia nuda]
MCRSIGAPPTGKKPDGSPLYTVPTIYDPSTGAAVSESTEIAIYLDAAYPDTPKLFPAGAHALQRDILDPHFRPSISSTLPVLQFTLPAIYTVLSPVSKPFFRKTKEAALGITLDDLSPKGKRRKEEWVKVRERYNNLINQLPCQNGPYILGREVSFLDFIVASHVLAIKRLLGENSMEWNEMKTWNRGRWVTICNSVKKYEIVV